MRDAAVITYLIGVAQSNTVPNTTVEVICLSLESIPALGLVGVLAYTPSSLRYPSTIVGATSPFHSRTHSRG